MEILKNNIEKAWIDNSMLGNIEIQKDIRKIIKLLDSGKLRIAENQRKCFEKQENALLCGALDEKKIPVPLRCK